MVNTAGSDPRHLTNQVLAPITQEKQEEEKALQEDRISHLVGTGKMEPAAMVRDAYLFPCLQILS